MNPLSFPPDLHFLRRCNSLKLRKVTMDTSQQ